MDKPSRFNIRVYGLFLHEGKVLVNEELIKGQRVIKFPGGGLDLGEGIKDCLVREWKEELGLDIDVLEHFYTNDFYQPSAFDNSQVISMYYRVTSDNVPGEIVNLVEQERSYWVSLSEVTAAMFTLPIDRRVGDMLRQAWIGGGL